MMGSVLFWDLQIINPWWGPSSFGTYEFLTHGRVRPLFWTCKLLTHGGVRPLFRTSDSSRLVVRFTQQDPECPFIKFELVEENTCPFLGQQRYQRKSSKVINRLLQNNRNLANIRRGIQT